MEVYKLEVKEYKNGKINFKIKIPNNKGALGEFRKMIKFLDCKLENDSDEFEKNITRE